MCSTLSNTYILSKQSTNNSGIYLQGKAISSTCEQNKLQVYIFALGLARKFLGFCVLGLKYHVLAVKMVVSD